MKLFFTLTILTLPFLKAWGQAPAKEAWEERYQLPIRKTHEKIHLDGIMNEEVWQDAAPIDHLMNHWPLDTGSAQALTEVWVTYDDEFLYIAAKCHDEGKERVVQSRRRDSENHWKSDAFTVVIDAFNRNSNGLMFGVNAGGAQVEGTVTASGSNAREDWSWDNKWYSEVKGHDSLWIAELAIPFKTLRYSETHRHWGINFIRNDMQRNAYSTWTQFPLNFRGTDMGHNGLLIWDMAPPKAMGKVALAPYLSGKIRKNHEENEGTIPEGSAGLDAKIALTPSLNMDLALNPDFSTIDVDQQLANVTRFSLSLPEKRNFFLENGDLFSNFGTWSSKPFFSRKIGLNDGAAVPISFGAKLSGNLGKNTRIGLMDVQTRIQDSLNAENYAVMALEKNILQRSTIKVLIANRESTEMAEGDSNERFNRIGGLEFRYLSSNGKLSSTTLYHHAYNPQRYTRASFYASAVSYNSRNVFGYLGYQKIGENFVSDMGFTPRIFNHDAKRDTTVRIGYQRVNPGFRYTFYPKRDTKVNAHGLSAWAQLFLNDRDDRFQEHRVFLNYWFNFKKGSELRLSLRNQEVRLPFPTDLIDSDVPLPVSRYKFTNGRIHYASDRRKPFAWRAALTHGDFFNGKITSFNGQVNLRVQSWGNFGLDYTLNNIQLPSPYGSTKLHLAGPKAEVSFSNTLLWTSFLQYNTQSGNFSINSRFQWRYRPMSDFFLVYSENHATETLDIKNRGIVFKATYWLNL